MYCADLYFIVFVIVLFCIIFAQYDKLFLCIIYLCIEFKGPKTRTKSLFLKNKVSVTVLYFIVFFCFVMYCILLYCIVIKTPQEYCWFFKYFYLNFSNVSLLCCCFELFHNVLYRVLLYEVVFYRFVLYRVVLYREGLHRVVLNKVVLY